MHGKRKAAEVAGPDTAKRQKGPTPPPHLVLNASTCLKRRAEDDIPNDPRIIKRLCLDNGRILKLVRFKLTNGDRPQVTTSPPSSAITQAIPLSVAHRKNDTSTTLPPTSLPSTSDIREVDRVRGVATRARSKRKEVPLVDQVRALTILLYIVRERRYRHLS